MSEYHRVNVYLLKEEHDAAKKMQKKRGCKSFSAYVLKLLNEDEDRCTAALREGISIGRSIAAKEIANNGDMLVREGNDTAEPLQEKAKRLINQAEAVIESIRWITSDLKITKENGLTVHKVSDLVQSPQSEHKSSESA
jgi:hypothetical protein